MPTEIERKYLIKESTLKFLKNNFIYHIIGIAQWYTDHANKELESKRIRLIINPDGSENWIAGTKKCLNNSLVFRQEIESEIEPFTETSELNNFPFILKIRYVFQEYPKAELVIDEFPENPFCKYNIDYLMEIEIDDSFKDPTKTFDDVYNFFKLPELKDVSEDIRFTNHAIARKSFNIASKTYEINAMKEYLEKKIKVVGNK